MLNFKLAIGALALVLCSAGCEAQRPIAETQAISKPQFSEPAVMGKVVDAETKQPIEGALIYGHYSTSSGTVAGGRKFGEAIKSFLAQTDANGEFKLDAWDTGDRVVSGVGGDRFPYIGIYKPGYDFWFDRLDSIAQWRPKSAVAGSATILADGTRDWRALPHQLKPAKTEYARYFALEISGPPMMTIGECGWEVYAPLLLAQHNELKDWYQGNVPAEFRDKNGYVKDFGPLPGDLRQLKLVFSTAVDRIVENSSRRTGCSDPKAVFKDKK